jgi:phosphoglycerate-specific signal transduction histidine kinase
MAHDITKRILAEEKLARHLESLEELVEERTDELTKANQQLNQQIEERKKAGDVLKERTDELQTMVNALAGREIRMVELKKVIKKLRSQLEGAGMKPVADDPLKEVSKDYT